MVTTGGERFDAIIAAVTLPFRNAWIRIQTPESYLELFYAVRLVVGRLENRQELRRDKQNL